MTLLQEIHNQKPAVRYTLFALSAFMVLSAVGFLWVRSLQGQVFMALHDDPAERAAFVVRQNESLPRPLALFTRGAGSLAAAIGELVGFDGSKGFDRKDDDSHTSGAVHLLPLSN